MIATISDGAGSARFGDEGSEMSCLALFDAVAAWIADAGLASPPTEECLREWAAAAHAAIVGEASAREVAPRDFACTLLCAVCAPAWSAYLQIGDGAIVVRDSSGLSTVFWPDGGEYANQTYFVTDSEYQKHLMTDIRCSPVEELAAITDGLQRLALNFADRSVHSAFFDPLLSALRQEKYDNLLALEEQLTQLIISPAVNARTDDDKTILLASMERGE